MSEDTDDGVSVTYDDLINEISDRNREDSERASSAGESRQKIKEFLDKTGVHPKVFSFARSILKQKKHTVQMDMMRSVKEVMPLVEACVDGNHGQPDMFDTADEEPVDYSEPGSIVDDEDAEDPDQDEENFGEDEEQQEFDAHLGEVADENGSVVPFGATRRA